MVQLIAKDRGVPEGWSWYQSEFKGETRAQGVFLVRGSCIAGTYTRGKNKGKPKRDKATERELVITPGELDAKQMQWERETGKCHRCTGKARLLKSMTKDATEYTACSRCRGTGAAPTMEAP